MLPLQGVYPFADLISLRDYSVKFVNTLTVGFTFGRCFDKQPRLQALFKIDAKKPGGCLVCFNIVSRKQLLATEYTTINLNLLYVLAVINASAAVTLLEQRPEKIFRF